MLLDIIFHEYNSSISVLYESFSTIGFHPTLRHGRFEEFVSGPFLCIWGCSLAKQLSGPSFCGQMFMRIAGCTSSVKNAAELGARVVWKPVRDEGCGLGQKVLVSGALAFDLT